MESAAIGASARSENMRLDSQCADAPTDLRAVTECAGCSVVIHVGGDIDASNESAWEHLLSRSAAKTVAPGPFVIDIRDLDFMGSRAYSALAHEAVECRDRGINLRLVTNEPIVAQTIAACGLHALLPTYTSVETALSPPVSG
jgi:anti-anti-sigma factor